MMSREASVQMRRFAEICSKGRTPRLSLHFRGISRRDRGAEAGGRFGTAQTGTLTKANNMNTTK